MRVKDTTFRDGVQGQGAEVTEITAFLKALRAIDSLGVYYHEVGFAVGDEKAAQRIKAALAIQHELSGKIAAFGRTHPTDVASMISLGVPVGVLVGKTRASDVRDVLLKSTGEYLNLIKESIEALVSAGIEVIFDAEHAFQAFLQDNELYAQTVLQTALDAGASYIVLCDTNGGTHPRDIKRVVEMAQRVVPVSKLGVHTHNDRGRAIANAEAAVEAGVSLVEGTIRGGERCGNMDLITFMANSHFEGVREMQADELVRMTEVYNIVCDAINLPPRHDAPYVGNAAFYTEAGMHESGNGRQPGNYLHVDPALVGNIERTGVTDQSGRANVIKKAEELGIEIPADKLSAVMEVYQTAVNDGINFSQAEESFHLMLLRVIGKVEAPFELSEIRVVDEKRNDGPMASQVTIRTAINGTQQLDVADGDGPVNALDNALRRALVKHLPQIRNIKLVDFNMTRVGAYLGTASKVRVVIEFSDGQRSWSTVSVKESMIEAALEALKEGYVYYLLTGCE
jgi:2-isopropylmalate synthase